MDTRLPLMVQSPDFAGSMTAGLQAGGLARQQAQQNALAQLYQQQGPQIMAGDPNALNSLARFDPSAAVGIQQNQLGMQQTRQSMAFDAEKMQMVRDQAKASVAEHAAQMSADQLAAETAHTEEIMRGAAPLYMAMQQGIPGAQERLLGYLQQKGIPASADNLDMLMYASQGALDGMKAYADLQPKTPAPADEYQRYVQEEQAAGRTPLTRLEFGSANRAPASGLTVTTNPDGTTTVTQGPVNAKPLTVDEAKNTGFAIRLRADQEILNKFEAEGTDLMAKIKSKDPTGLMNYAQTPEYQQYEQAKRDFINAVLRRESGAAISPSEFANADQQYFPQPGDSPELIAQKKAARDVVLAGVVVGAGPGASNVIAKGMGTQGRDFSAMDMTQLLGVDTNTLTLEEANAYNAAMQGLNK